MNKNKKMTLRDVIAMSVISIVFGILYLFWIFINGTFGAAIGPFSTAILSGLWIMACTVCGYIIQKPGVAFVAQMMAALTEVLVGSVSAGSVLILGFTQGLACELILLILMYKAWGRKTIILMGMAGTMGNFLTSYYLFEWNLLAPWMLTSLIIIMLLSGGITGWWSVLIAESLGKTGVLDSFPVMKGNQGRAVDG
ncbi:ECF transporter S component [Marinilactibacillus sp. Marseille-P9653]|uniref:ECF transporter S component n=1 Tax=Marinilactibacillus sp. Marseille-P9653 TaxID=2866583 RepID=UPI001CE48248|nr:ECF transporter S component [Marinilactibacillus sp. Marseille-P9653]